MTATDLLVDLSDDELEAWNHAAERVRVDGHHSLNGCPAYCRAMCSYESLLKALEARGVEVPK